MTADEAKQKVLAVHPKAGAVWDPCSRSHPPHKFIWTVYSGDMMRLAQAFSEAEAWIEAALKLPTPIPTSAEQNPNYWKEFNEDNPLSETQKERSDYAASQRYPKPTPPATDASLCGSCAHVLPDHFEGCFYRLAEEVAPPSTEESGEPVALCCAKGEDLRPDASCEKDKGHAGCHETMDGYMWWTSEPESADYLRGKLDGFNEGVEKCAALAYKQNYTLLAEYFREWKRGNS